MSNAEGCSCATPNADTDGYEPAPAEHAERVERNAEERARSGFWTR